MLRVTNIQEDDFGCEERPEDWEPRVIVTLTAEDGSRRWQHVPDRTLRERGIDIGSPWPEDLR